MAPHSTCFPLPNESGRPGVKGREEEDDSVASRGGGGACNVGPNEGTQRRQVGTAAVAMTRECWDLSLSPFSFRSRHPRGRAPACASPSASPAEGSSGSALQLPPAQPEAQPSARRHLRRPLCRARAAAGFPRWGSRVPWVVGPGACPGGPGASHTPQQLSGPPRRPKLDARRQQSRPHRPPAPPS